MESEGAIVKAAALSYGSNIGECAFGVADRCDGSPFQEGGPGVCSNYRRIALLSLPRKVYSGVMER